MLRTSAALWAFTAFHLFSGDLRPRQFFCRSPGYRPRQCFCRSPACCAGAAKTINPRLAAAKQVLAPALQVTRPYRNRSQPLTRRRGPSRIEPRQTAAKKETPSRKLHLVRTRLAHSFFVNAHPILPKLPFRLLTLFRSPWPARGLAV